MKSKEPLKISAKLTLFLKSLKKGNFVICLDDFDQVSDVENIANLFALMDNDFEGRQGEIPAHIILMASTPVSVMRHIENFTLEKL